MYISTILPTSSPSTIIISLSLSLSPAFPSQNTIFPSSTGTFSHSLSSSFSCFPFPLFIIPICDTTFLCSSKTAQAKTCACIYSVCVCVCVSMCVCFNLLSRLHRSYSSSSFNSVLFRSDRLFIYYLVHESRVVHVHGVVLECGIDRSRVDWFQDH